MLQTKFGPFNGKTWEDLCQLVFKKKYDHIGYQHMAASPGDYGLEGFTLQLGIGFQCYCPDKNYSAAELYEKQRTKITTDLGKLKTYEAQIAARIGEVKIREWHFVTPEVGTNALHVHARNKEAEVRAWNISILDPEFTIHLRDAEFYFAEINEVRSLNGEALNFDTSPHSLPVLTGPPEEYEANLRRKTELRLAPQAGNAQAIRQFTKLYDQTQKAFLQHSNLLRQIERTAPTVYFRLVRLVSEYENTVSEMGVTWRDSAEELVNKVRDGLADRIVRQLGPHIDETDANKIARHIVARWLAVCELDFA